LYSASLPELREVRVVGGVRAVLDDLLGPPLAVAHASVSSAAAISSSEAVLAETFSADAAGAVPVAPELVMGSVAADGALGALPEPHAAS
jgi:hypothetical protein